MNITPFTPPVRHAALKKAGLLLLVLLMLSVSAGTQAAIFCFPPSGDLAFDPFGIFRVEIAGLTPCTEHDQTNVGGELSINSTTLKIDLLNDFVPAFRDSFDILNWGSINGTFGTIDASAAVLPAPLVWNTSKLYTDGELIVDVQHFEDGDLAPWDNPDGLINAADVLIAEQLVLGLRTPGALQYAHGDMNSDGEINTADLLLIAQDALTI
jgi:hypothetical protein